MSQQHWSRWYTAERCKEMDLKELKRHHATLTNALKAFSSVPDANAEQIKEVKAVLWLITRTIKEKT